jgi:hypothetical protein
MHYELALHLVPEHSFVEVAGTLSLPILEDNTSEALFLLNRRFQLNSLRCAECAEHTFEAAKHDVYMYAPDAAPLTVRFRRELQAGDRVQLQFAYGGRPVPVRSATGSPGPNWVELALYDAWFPMQHESRSFTYDVSITVDPTWQVSGGGQLTRASVGKWRLQQAIGTFDINIVASRSLRNFTLEDSALPLRIDYVGLDGDTVKRMGRTTTAIASQFAAWFGDTASEGLTIVFADRSRGGGYSRPGFICYERAYMSRLPEAELSAALAHEIAHLWWSGAPVETWEDWLNESFAEYAAAMFVRTFHGQKAFDSRLSDYRKETTDTRAIRGIDRKSPQAYAALYKKGPLILHQLEKAMGQEAFGRFLAALIQEEIHSTERLLSRLEEFSSRDVRQHLEFMLAASGPIPDGRRPGGQPMPGR